MATFPALPGVDVKIERAPSYATTVIRMWNGKEVRIGRRTNAIVSVRLRVNFARDAVAAPSPWAAYSEHAIIRKFHADSLGSLYTFEVADPDGGALLTVRFASDSLALTQIVPGIWSGDIDLVQVI